jgi:hypothetical protein
MRNQVHDDYRPTLLTEVSGTVKRMKPRSTDLR